MQDLKSGLLHFNLIPISTLFIALVLQRHLKNYNALTTQVKDFSTFSADKKIQNKRIKLWHFKRRVAKALGSKNASRKKFLYGHTNGKAAIRTSAPIVKIFCHLPEPVRGKHPTLIVSKSFYVLHFDCMGFHGWKSKWANRISGDHKFSHKRFSSFRINLENKVKKALDDEEKLKSFYVDYTISPPTNIFCSGRWGCSKKSIFLLIFLISVVQAISVMTWYLKVY